MHTLIRLFHPREGRVSRSLFWLAVVVSCGFSIFVGAIFYLAGVFASVEITGLVLVDGVPQPINRTQLVLPGWATLIVWLAWALPMTVVGVKRRRDRDFPGWDVVLLFALWLAHYLATINGLRNDWMSALNIVLTIWLAVLVFYLGFLKGSHGSNAYGPDPLGNNTGER